MIMYYRTFQAAVWSAAAVDQSTSTAADMADIRSAEHTIWAKVPLQTRRGRCVAVKLRGGDVLIGIASAPAVQWLPAQKVITEAEMEAWLRVGFK